MPSSSEQATERTGRALSRVPAGAIEPVLASALIAVNAWVALGMFLSIARGSGRVEYMFVSARWTTLAACGGGAACAVLLLQRLAAGHYAGPVRQWFSPKAAYHLRPLRWLACSLVPLLALIFPSAGILAPLWYVLFDLRWYWWPLVLWEVLRRIQAGGSGCARRAWPEAATSAALAGVVLTLGVLFTPHLRFSGVLHGDEPKYVRFCENWYQGLGFDISNNRPLVEASGPEYPRIADNIRHLLRAVPEEFRLLAADARRLMTGSGPPRLIAPDSGGSLFFAGKHPSTVYQLHYPGVSFLLFPAYVLDRTLTGEGVGYHRQFPASMPALHTALLTIFAGYTLALYALLRAYSRRRAWAWIFAFVGSTSMPAGAFVFQIYPEIASGLIVFLLMRWLVREAPSTPAVAIGYGLLAGFLPWLHVRFGMAAAVIIGAAMLRERGWRPRILILLGVAIPLGLLSLYVYRLTGSLLPTATYGSEVPLSFERFSIGLPALALDRVWGLFPHTPVYLLAIPGLVVAWRERRREAIVVLLVIAVVMLPSAAHAFAAGGTTPGRYLVPIAPLLLLFVADAAARWSSRRVFVGVFAVLAIVSIETAVRYNLHHIKNVAPLVPYEFSGWRFNLLFPSVAGYWSTEATLAVAAWVAACAMTIAGAWFFIRERRPSFEAIDANHALKDVMAGLFGLAAIGLLTVLVGAKPFDARYMVPPGKARDRAITFFATLPGCAVCYSSSTGAVPPTAALGNDVGTVQVRLVRPRTRTGTAIRIRVRPRTADGEFVLASIRIEFGDGTEESHSRIFGDLTTTHVYQKAGEYTVRALVTSSPDRSQEQTLRIRVRD